ncbi:MAG: hypothetical protein K0S37_2711 [Microbacterium sp.]|jgi:putative ABC transport system permease protein|nr:hypothetical protein [Microbacterium sp.]
MRGIPSWRPTLRLALRDTRAHALRTVLSCLLIALPIAALVAWAAVQQAPTPSRDQALASIPSHAQAVLTATTLSRDAPPFPQLPEGAPGPWNGDLETAPPTADELAAALPPGNRLIPFWQSLELIATTGLNLAPGVESTAGADVASADIDVSTLSTGRLIEADAEGLGILIPALDEGRMPIDDTEAVVSRAFAERLGLSVGDDVSLVAPPWSGWYGSNGEGRLGEVVQNVQRGYRVSGIAPGTAQTAWAPAGWMSRLVAADPVGIDGRWLVVGDAPVTWENAQQLNALQTFAVSRDVLENYPPASALYPVETDAKALVERAAVTILVAFVGALLVLGLVTPAFAVAADESRRMLGLAAVAGATPRDLRRTILLQGGLVGVGGGIAGVGLGIAGGALLVAAAYPGANMWTRFPVWAPLAGVAIAVAIGLVATLGPARRAARLQPVDAVRDRLAPPITPGRGRVIMRAVLPAVLAVLAIIAGWGAFARAGAFHDALAQLPAEYRAPGQTDPSAALLVAVTVVVGASALVLGIRALLSVAGSVAGRAPLALRLAVRDGLDHPTRVVPAAAGVLVAVLAASALLVVTGSGTQNNRDSTGQMIGAGHVVLGTFVPVSPAFDRLVLADSARALAEDLPVTGTLPIETTALDGSRYLEALPAPEKTCPAGRAPDAPAMLDPDETVTCRDAVDAYSPSMSVAWMGGTNTYVLSPDAVRASGIAGADAAADVLEAGGAIVNDATRLSGDGEVRLAVGADMFPGEEGALSITPVPGAFLRGFAPPLTVSPETARALGITEFDFVGEYVLTSRPLTAGELDRAREIVTTHTSLVTMATPQNVDPWGDAAGLAPVLALASLAVAATTVSLLLARTQARRDATTMYAVGATPRFLRRVALAQGSLILLLGVPLGLGAGLAMGSYVVAWSRFAGSPGSWLQTIPLWDLQGLLAVVVVAASLVGVLLVARPPRRAVRRVE